MCKDAAVDKSFSLFQSCVENKNRGDEKAILATYQ